MIEKNRIEILGHFNINFKVETDKGFFHLKILKDGTEEWTKWIEGETVRVWTKENLFLLKEAISNLQGTAKEMDFFQIDIKDKKFYKLLEKYKDDKKVYCHNDINKDNVVINDKLELIDFEFARMNHPYWEWANVINEDSVKKELILEVNYDLETSILDDWIYINRVFNNAWNTKHKNNK